LSTGSNTSLTTNTRSGSIAPLLTAQIRYQTYLLAMNPLGFSPLYGNASDASGNGNNGTVMNGPNNGNVEPGEACNWSLEAIVLLSKALDA